VKVTVAILNYNGKDHLDQYLPSVLAHLDGHDLLVIDNASTDDSVAFLKAKYPSIRLKINTSNGGFAAGYNEGLKGEDADLFVLLNSDVEVTESWISGVIHDMESCAWQAAQPKILADKKRTHFEHAGAAGGFIDYLGYPFCRGRMFDKTEEDKGQYDERSEIFWATGACMFIQSKVFFEMGGFDADYFAHMEEIDLCWRMKNKGYKIGYSPNAIVYHLGGGTLNYSSPRKTYLNFRNSLITLLKNEKKFVFWKVFWRLALDGVAGLKFLFSGQLKHFWAIIRAHFSFYMRLPSTLNKRRKIPKLKKLGQIYSKSIVFQYYLKGKKKYSDLQN
jgi:GT2 family glycosyltransferase